jgi:hypothetical protein
LTGIHAPFGSKQLDSLLMFASQRRTLAQSVISLKPPTVAAISS